MTRDLFAELQSAEAGLALAYALHRKYGCWQAFLDDRFAAYELAGRRWRMLCAIRAAAARPMLTVVA